MKTIHRPAFLLLSILALTAPAQAFEIHRANVADNGSQADARSRDAAMSADGRYVAFATRATNLTSGQPGNRFNIYERDRLNGTTMRITRSINTLPPDGDSVSPHYDADGRLLVFQSQATNLVSGDPGQSDILLYERATGRIIRLTLAADGGQPDGGSTAPLISADGSTVVFESVATNLVADDTNGVRDIFVHYTRLGETRLVSITSDGRQTDATSFDAGISDDGRFVSFTSLSSNLTETHGGLSRVFVHDLLAGTTTRVGGGLGDRRASDVHDQARISGDGRHVAFRRVRDGGAGAQTVFLADLDAGSVVPVTPGDLDADFNVVGVSRHGRHVLFDTASGQVAPGAAAGTGQVYLFDAQSGETRRVSGPGPGTAGNGESRGLALSPDGRHALFFSSATNLVPGDSNRAEDVFLNDLKEFAIGPDTTGSWYDPAQDGQGFILEYLAGDRLLFYWFTFQPAGGRDWIYGILDVDGVVATGPAFQRAGGGLFPPAFDPADAPERAWGEVTFEFSGCDAGEVRWNSTRAGYGSGAFPVVRLTAIPGLPCD